MRPQRAAAYLIVDGDSAAFVDNNTANAVPRLIETLESCGRTPEHVAYAIVTHVHLDHAGGTAALLKACPNAIALAHPRAVRHLTDPARLVESARQVYGEALFRRLYGSVEPVPQPRVRAVEDGERVPFGGRSLFFMHTSGHARHHISMYDPATDSVFTGDTFGVGSKELQRGTKPFLLCSTAPTEFEPEKARESAHRIAATGATRAYLTHFGEIENVAAASVSLLESINAMECVLTEATSSPLEGNALAAFCEERVKQAVHDALRGCGIAMTPDDEEWLAGDIRINALGLAYCAARLRSPKNPSPA